MRSDRALIRLSVFISLVWAAIVFLQPDAADYPARKITREHVENTVTPRLVVDWNRRLQYLAEQERQSSSVGPHSEHVSFELSSAAQQLPQLQADHAEKRMASGKLVTKMSAIPPTSQLYTNCHIITLKRDQLRVNHVRNQTVFDFPGAHIDWAIDGRDLSDENITHWKQQNILSKRLTGFMDPAKPVGKPKIACLMSHVQLWRQLATEHNDDAFYFILEDDTFPAADFHSRYQALLMELKGLAWDWVYLAIHPTWKRGNKLTIEGKTLINRAPRMVGNAGYLISARGARKLLMNLFPVSLPKDQAIRILIQRKIIEAYIVKTQLIHVKGQQGQGFKGSLDRDPTRTFKSNIWDK